MKFITTVAEDYQKPIVLKRGEEIGRPLGPSHPGATEGLRGDRFQLDTLRQKMLWGVQTGGKVCPFAVEI